MNKKSVIAIIAALTIIIVGILIFLLRRGVFAHNDTAESTSIPDAPVSIQTEATLPTKPTFALPSFEPPAEAAVRCFTISEEAGTGLITLHLPETDSLDINKDIRLAVRKHADAFTAVGPNDFFDARYEIHRYNNYLMGIVLICHTYTEADGLQTVQEAMTIDLMGGRTVHLSELFAHDYDYIAASADTIRAQLSSAALAAADETEHEALIHEAFDLSDPITGDYGSFVFDTERITFFFQTSDGTALTASVPLSDYGAHWQADLYAMQYFGSRTGDIPMLDDAPPTRPNLNPSEAKYLALTFDDGPDRVLTTRLLDGLLAYDARVTFFVVGHRLGTTADIVKRMVDEGHAVGNHSYNHANLANSSNTGIAYQIDATNDLLHSILNQETPLLRPPYGARDARVVKIAAERDMSLIMWSIDPQDWRIRDAKIVSDHIVSRAKNGDIILLHDIHPTSIDAALMAVKQLTEDGFTFITVDELLELNGGRITGGIYRAGSVTVTE